MRLNEIYTPRFPDKQIFYPTKLIPTIYGIYNYTARLLSVIYILTSMPLSSLRFVWEFELAARS